MDATKFMAMRKVSGEDAVLIRTEAASQALGDLSSKACINTFKNGVCSGCFGKGGVKHSFLPGTKANCLAIFTVSIPRPLVEFFTEKLQGKLMLTISFFVVVL